MTEFQVKYFDGKGNLSHEYTEHFEYDDSLFCPNCAARAVWVDQSGGDFYVGENHVCIECGTVFCLPIIRCASDDEQDRQRVEGIKRGLTKRPPDECHEAVCEHKFTPVTNTLEVCVLCGIRR